MKLKNKKLLILTMAITLSLAACGKASEAEKEDISETVQISDTRSEDRDEFDESTNADIQAEIFNTNAHIAETLLVDENDIKIMATDLQYSDYSVDLHLVIENNSDTIRSIVSGSAGYSCNSINGYMIDDGYLNTEVAPGKKENELISFGIEGLSLYGIHEIADISVGFDIQDEEYNHFYSGPRQVKTSLADAYEYSVDTYRNTIESGMWEAAYGCTIDYFAEEELYDQNGIKILSETLVTNQNGEKVMFLEIQNDSQEAVYGTTSNISLNELFVHNSVWSSDPINPGTRGIIDLSISSMIDPSYWEMFGIMDVSTFTFSFTVNDLDYNEIVPSQQIYIAMSEELKPIDVSGQELYNENGIHIVSKGFVEDSSEYAEDIHLLLLIENNSSEMVRVDDSYQSFSVNGFMSDCYVQSVKADAGKCAMMDINIPMSVLENNKISGIEDILEAEITLEVKDKDNHTFMEPVLSVGQ